MVLTYILLKNDACMYVITLEYVQFKYDKSL